MAFLQLQTEVTIYRFPKTIFETYRWGEIPPAGRLTQIFNLIKNIFLHHPFIHGLYTSHCCPIWQRASSVSRYSIYLYQDCGQSSLSKVRIRFSRVALVASLAPAGLPYIFCRSAVRRVKMPSLGEMLWIHAARPSSPLRHNHRNKEQAVISTSHTFHKPIPASLCSCSEDEQLLKCNKLGQKVQHVPAFRQSGTATAFTAYDSDKPHQRHRSVWSKQQVI